MIFYNSDELVEYWDKNATLEDKQERYEIEEIKKDIEVARKYLKDCLSKYRKDKTRSRSKAKSSDPFSELDMYNSREDIRDAYGWEFISEKEMDRLIYLWDLREESKNKTALEDRVTMIIEHAIQAAGDEYFEQIYAYDVKRGKMRKEAERIVMDNIRGDKEVRI